MPATPVLDLAVVVLSVLTGVVCLVAIVLLSQVHYGPTQMGTNAVAFYFVALPVTLVALAAAVLLAVAVNSRHDARMPRPVTGR